MVVLQSVLLKILSNAKVSALDISKDALEVARENAVLNNVNIEFINADIFEYHSDKKYDVIVSNPPYVLESEKSLMKQNVLDFEPRQALFVTDSDPLKYYEFIMNYSKNHLYRNGQIFFEINENKRKGIENILDENDQYKSDFLHDSFKKTRFLKIRF